MKKKELLAKIEELHSLATGAHDQIACLYADLNELKHDQKQRIEELESAVCALEINETRLMKLVERLQEDLANVVELHGTLKECIVTCTKTT